MLESGVESSRRPKSNVVIGCFLMMIMSVAFTGVIYFKYIACVDESQVLAKKISYMNRQYDSMLGEYQNHDFSFYNKADVLGSYFEELVWPVFYLTEIELALSPGMRLDKISYDGRKRVFRVILITDSYQSLLVFVSSMDVRDDVESASIRKKGGISPGGFSYYVDIYI